MPKIGFLPISLRTCCGLILQRLRIAGTVREKDAVGLQRQHVFGGWCDAGTTVTRAPTWTRRRRMLRLMP